MISKINILLIIILLLLLLELVPYIICKNKICKNKNKNIDYPINKNPLKIKHIYL